MNYKEIKSAEQLNKLQKKWQEQGVRTVAVDLEAECNLHMYGEKLCLVQIYDASQKYIVDPFKTGLAAVKKFFENDKFLKIFYDASSDLSLLKNAHDISVSSLLDLKPAVDLLDYPQKGLDGVLNTLLGVKIQKKGKYQRYNWTRRPLPPDVLVYALGDVLYLFDLKEILLDELMNKGLWDEFYMRNLMIQNKDYVRNPEDQYKKIPGFRKLNAEERGRCRKIFQLRDRYAEKYNVPSHNILEKRALADLSKGRENSEQIKLYGPMSPEDKKLFMKELHSIYSQPLSERFSSFFKRFSR